MEFEPFTKIARLSRECTITEKIDGTNGQVYIAPPGEFVPVASVVYESDGHLMLAGSRTRYITPTEDNHGFARWVQENAQELMKLGPGRHFGEWWGSGIQRGYGLPKGEKRFSLFNTSKWGDDAMRPACCHVVPVLYNGIFGTDHTFEALTQLHAMGSAAAPGFMNPEGIIIYHHAANFYFKKTLHKDEEWKGKPG